MSRRRNQEVSKPENSQAKVEEIEIYSYLLRKDVDLPMMTNKISSDIITSEEVMLKSFLHFVLKSVGFAELSATLDIRNIRLFQIPKLMDKVYENIEFLQPGTVPLISRAAEFKLFKPNCNLLFQDLVKSSAIENSQLLKYILTWVKDLTMTKLKVLRQGAVELAGIIFLSLVKVGNLAESENQMTLFKNCFHEILVPRFKDARHEVRSNLLTIFSEFLKHVLDIEEKRLTTRKRTKKGLEEMPAIKSIISQIVEISQEMLLTQEPEIQLQAIKVMDKAVEYLNVSLSMVGLCFSANVRVVAELVKLFSKIPKKLEDELVSLVSKLIYSPNQVISEAAADFLIELQKPIAHGKEGLLSVIKFLSEFDPQLGRENGAEPKLQLILSVFQDRIPLLSNYDMMIGLLEETPYYFEIIISILIVGLKRAKALKKKDNRNLITFSHALLKKAKILINTHKMDKVKFPKIVKLFGLLEGEALNKIESKPALEELSKAVSILADYENEIEALADICHAFQKMSIDAVLTKDIIENTQERLYNRIVKPILSELPYSHESNKFGLAKALSTYSQVIESMDPCKFLNEGFVSEVYGLKDELDDSEEVLFISLMKIFYSFHLWQLKGMMNEPSIPLYQDYIEMRNKTVILLHQGMSSNSETVTNNAFEIICNFLSLVSSDKIGEAKTMFYDPKETIEILAKYLKSRLKTPEINVKINQLNDMLSQCSVSFFYSATNGLINSIFDENELIQTLDDALRSLRIREIQPENESKFFFWKVVQETIFYCLSRNEAVNLRPFIKRVCKIYFQNPKKIEERIMREKFVLFIADTIVKVFEDEEKIGAFDCIGIMMKGRALDVRLMRKLLAFFQIELQKKGKSWLDAMTERNLNPPIDRFSDTLLRLSQAEMLKEETNPAPQQEEAIQEEACEEEEEEEVYNSPEIKPEGEKMVEESNKENSSIPKRRKHRPEVQVKEEASSEKPKKKRIKNK